MKKLFVILGLALLPVQAASADVLDLVEGNWGIATETVPDDLDAEAMEKARGCKSTPVIITVDRKKKRYKAVHTGEEKWISIRYDDEDRLMENGDPQIWHMFFVSDDEFYWIVGPGIQKNEREGIVSTSRVRCKSKIS